MQKPKCFFDQKGAAMVEFAIVLPLLVVVLLGIIEFSYAYSRLNTLNKATHEAARWFSDPKQARNGVFNGDINLSSDHVNTAKTIIKEFDNSLSSLQDNDISITSPITDHIQIKIVYSHSFLLSNALSSMLGLLTGSSSSLGPNITLTASSVMRVQ